MGIKKGASALWYSELGLHQLGSRPTVFIPRWTNTPLHSISSVCHPWGYVAVLIPETCLSSVVGRVSRPGQSHGCYPVRATRRSLPCRLYLLAPLTGHEKESNEIMVHRVRHIPTQFPIKNALHVDDQHTLAFYIKCVPPVGQRLLYRAVQELTANSIMKSQGWGAR